MLVSQHLVGREHVGRPASCLVRFVDLRSVEVVRVDAPLGLVKRIRTARLLAIALVAPRDTAFVFDSRHEHGARRARYDDGRPGGARLIARAWLGAREHPGIHSLEHEARADDVDREPWGDAVVCQYDETPAGA